MNALELRWLLYFIIIEFFVVLFFIITCYAIKLYYFFKNSKDKKQFKELEDILLQNKPIPPIYQHKVELILNVFKHLDEQNIPNWNESSCNIMQDQILPYARKFIDSKSWEKRYLLVLCLKYCIKSGNEDLILRFINDKNAMVSFNGIQIASQLGTPRLLKAILYKLQLEPHPYHVIAIRELSQSKNLNEVIKDELKISSDSWFKKICYEILNVIGGPPEFFELAKRDCYSDNINLRLAAIRALPYLDKNQYIEIYKQLITDENWMIRNAVVKTLRETKDIASLDILANSLQDPVWWVRVNAAKTLANLGDEGQLLLTEYKALNLEGYEEAAYFLKIQRLRTNPNYD